MLRRVRGDEHTDTHRTMGRMGQMLSSLGDHAGALPLLEAAAAGLQRTAGSE
eukprot:COSAG06_NODE_45389_length_355_cov_0.808594_1_plen_51_part_10